MLFVKKERRNLSVYTNSTHIKWENHMDKEDRDKRWFEYIWFRKCLSWSKIASGADGQMRVGAQEVSPVMLWPRCPLLAAARGSGPVKRILCSSSIWAFPCCYIPDLGSQQTKHPAHLWPWLYLQHLLLRPDKGTWTAELPCKTRVCPNIALAGVKVEAQLYMKQTSGKGKELWGLLTKALM